MAFSTLEAARYLESLKVQYRVARWCSQPLQRSTLRHYLSIQSLSGRHIVLLIDIHATEIYHCFARVDVRRQAASEYYAAGNVWLFGIGFAILSRQIDWHLVVLLWKPSQIQTTRFVLVKWDLDGMVHGSRGAYTVCYGHVLNCGILALLPPQIMGLLPDTKLGGPKLMVNQHLFFVYWRECPRYTPKQALFNDCMTSIPSINKTDALALASTFGSMEKVGAYTANCVLTCHFETWRNLFHIIIVKLLGWYIYIYIWNVTAARHCIVFQ